MNTSSAAIPLPKSHIHRTPSELQFDDDVRRAEHQDVRMYARIVVGMQSQCQVSGYVHPLTRKSLQDILRTRQANDKELERKSSALRDIHHEEDEEQDDMEISHRTDERDETSVHTPRPRRPIGTSKRAPTVVKAPSGDGSIMSHLRQEEMAAADPEDDLVFSLEL